MGVCARGAVIDNNEAEHNEPPPGIDFLVKTRRDFSRLLPIKIRFDWPLFPDRRLVIGCVSRAKAGALSHRDVVGVAASQRQ
jgi:hypothetical protein